MKNLILTIIIFSLIICFPQISLCQSKDGVVNTRPPGENWNANDIVYNDSAEKARIDSVAEAQIIQAYIDVRGTPPVGTEHYIHLNSVLDNWATLEEVLANIVSRTPPPVGSNTGSNTSGMAGAVKAYQTFCGITAPGGCEPVDPPRATVTTTFSGSATQGGNFTTIVTGFQNWKKDIPAQYDDAGNKTDDAKTQTGTASKSFSFETASIKPNVTGRSTPEAEMYLKIIDITAPWVKFHPGFEPGTHSATTGDYQLVKCDIYDNNRYAKIRNPWLYYETKPVDGGAEFWCSEPLILESEASPSLPGVNKGTYRAMIPLPYSHKGNKCIKWYVDVHDGSNFSHHCGGGNHNRSDCAHGDSPQSDVHGTDYGLMNLYDNDRPNITLRIYEKTRTGIEKIATYEAKENYDSPDLYNGYIAGSSNFKGIIPGDEQLKSGNIPVPTDLQPYLTAGLEASLRKTFNKQIKAEKEEYKEFEFTIGQQGEVIYEDRKYFFVVDVDDNVSHKSINGSSSEINKLQRTKLYYKFKEPSDNIDMASFEEIPRSGNLWHWYLSPDNPVNFETGKKDCYSFEHIFHTHISGEEKKDTAYLYLRAVDKADHERNLRLFIRVGDVRSEFTSFDSKLKK